MRFEAKMKTFAASWNPERDGLWFGRQLASTVAEAAPALRRRSSEDGVLGLNVVTFLAVVPLKHLCEIRTIDLEPLLQREFASIPGTSAPHAIVARWWGLGMSNGRVVAVDYQHLMDLDAVPSAPPGLLQTLEQAMR